MSSRLLRARPTLSVVARVVTASVIAAAVVAVPAVVGSAPAHAATTDQLTVTSTADSGAGTLRAALLTAAADLDGGDSVSIGFDVSPSNATIDLASPLQLSPNTAPAAGLSVTIGGGGATLDGQGTSQILDLDGDVVGNVNVSISDLNFENGSDSGPTAFGGAAILDGDGGAGAGDTLAVTGSTFTDNTETVANVANYGGAIQLDGGSLAVTDSTFTGNATTGSSGGALAYLATGPGQSLTVTGSTFTSNVAGNDGGGAIAVFGGAHAPAMTLSKNVFSANQSSGALQSTVYVDSGSLTSTANTFSGDRVAYYVEGGAALSSTYDFFLSGQQAINRPDSTATVTASDEWAGCSGSASCATFASGISPSTLGPVITAPATATAGTAITAELSLVASGGTSGDGVVPFASLPAVATSSASWTLTSTDATGTFGSPSFASTPAAVSFTPQTAGSQTITASFLGQSTTSGTIAVAAPPTAPAFPAAPTAITVVAGQTLSTTITLTGNPVPVATASGVSWITATQGSGGVKLSGTAPAAAGSSVLTLVATSSAGTTQQNITITVVQLPSFASEPSDVTAASGTDASFTAALTPDTTPTPTEQWQSSSDGTTWTDVTDGAAVSGAQTDTLTLDGVTDAQSGTQYRAVASNAATVIAGAVTSAVATLTVGDAPTITAPSTLLLNTGVPVASVGFSVGGSGTITISALGLPAGLTLSQSGDSATIAPSQGGGWSLGESQVTLVATSAFGTTQQTVTLIVASPVSIGSPVDQYVNPGADATFSTFVGGGPDTVEQWQSSTDGTTWTDVTDGTGVSGAQTDALTLDAVTAAQTGTQYRVVVTNALESETSNPATLYVGAAPVFTLPPTLYLPAGETGVAVPFTFYSAVGYESVTASAGAGVPQLVSASNGEYDFTLTVNAPAARQTVTGTVAVTTLFGTDTQSITLVGATAPAVTTQPSAQTVISGASATFTAAASGFPQPTVQWQSSPDGVSWTDVPSATTNTLTLTAASADSGTQYRAVFTNGLASATTNAATLTVTAPPLRSLPGVLPLSFDGPLSGVPAHLHRGEHVTVSGHGFAPGSIVQFGVYSSPTALVTATASAAGVVTATVTIPAGLAPYGTHTLVAVGTSPVGAELLLGSAFQLVAVVAPSSPGTPASVNTPTSPTQPGVTQLAATGAAEHGGELLLLALGLLLTGAAVLTRRRLARR